MYVQLVTSVRNKDIYNNNKDIYNNNEATGQVKDIAEGHISHG